MLPLEIEKNLFKCTKNISAFDTSNPNLNII